MKIAAFLGSPREGGNTDTLLDMVLAKAESQDADTEKIYLAKMDISGCRECFGCQKHQDTPGCVVQDDMQLLYDK